MEHARCMKKSAVDWLLNTAKAYTLFYLYPFSLIHIGFHSWRPARSDGKDPGGSTP